MYNTEELSKYIFANRNKIFAQPTYKGKDPIMSLITTLLPFVLIASVIALVGFLFLLRQFIKYSAKGLECLFSKGKSAYTNYKQKKQQEQEEKQKQEEFKEQTDIYDSSVIQLRQLIKNNFNRLQTVVMKTGERKGKKHGIYTWVTFTVFDTNKKQVINVNDLVNNVCYRMLEVSKKDGDYLKGSLIFPYADYQQLEGRLSILLQTRVIIEVA